MSKLLVPEDVRLFLWPPQGKPNTDATGTHRKEVCNSLFGREALRNLLDPFIL